jgi:hypothetical protein
MTREERGAANDVAFRTVIALIEPTTDQVRYNVLDRIHTELTQLGYTLIHREPFGADPGRQLFWRNGFILVRVKTRGDGRGPRQGIPHASVGLHDREGIAWRNDLAKYDANGQLRPKSLGSAAQFEADLNSTDPEVQQRAETRRQTHRFEVLLGGQTPGDHRAISDAWADGVHFGFANNQLDATNADNLPVVGDGQPT